MPVSRRIRSLLPLAGLFSATVIMGALLFAFHMHRVLQRATQVAAASHRLPFRFGPYRAPAEAGFTPVGAPANLRAGAVLDGEIYLSGPGELAVFDPGGAPRRTWRSGLELPGTALGGVTPVRLRGMTHTQIAVATSDAGVLFVDASGGVAQLLPGEPKLRNITALAALPDGELILGTQRGGVLVFDGETLALYRPDLAGLAVTALLAVQDGVWIGTQNNGVYLVQGGTTKNLAAQLPDPHVESLAGEAGRVFVGTPDGVAEFAGGQRVLTLAQGTFAHAMVAQGSTLTVAALEGGTVEVPLGTAYRASIGIVTPSAQERTEQFLFMPGSRDLWAVRADGLYRRRSGAWTRMLGTEAATLADANVSALAFAPDGKLWIGYFDHGIDIVDATGGRARHRENDQLFCVNRIAVDPRRETMAVATANGLVLFDHAGEPRQVLRRRDGLISEHVNDVVFDGDTMTVGTSAGLSFVGPAGVESLYAFGGLVNNHVYALAVSPGTGEMVAGTLGGVSVMQRGEVRRNVTASNSALRHNWITAVMPLPHFAGDGYLLGTYGGGLLQMNAAGGIATMPGAARDGIINPNALLVTETHVFAGSLGGGLWVFGRSSQRWQQVTAGLPSLNVTALAAQHGELYVGTENGLVHLAEARLPA